MLRLMMGTLNPVALGPNIVHCGLRTCGVRQPKMPGHAKLSGENVSNMTNLITTAGHAPPPDMHHRRTPTTARHPPPQSNRRSHRLDTYTLRIDFQSLAIPLSRYPKHLVPRTESSQLHQIPPIQPNQPPNLLPKPLSVPRPPHHLIAPLNHSIHPFYQLIYLTSVMNKLPEQAPHVVDQIPHQST